MENKGANNQPVNQKKGTMRMILFIVAVVGIPLVIYFVVQGLIASNTQKTLGANPEESTFYMGNYKNHPILYYRYADMIINDLPAPRRTGHIVPLDRPYNLATDPKIYIDFKDLQNPKKIFNFKRHAGIANYMLNKDKDMLMISYVSGPMDTTNYIYQFNLKTLESKKAWEHELRTGQSPYNGGIAHITQFIPDKYVVFAIVKSNPPPKEMPVGVIVRNMQTGNEKVLGTVGDVQLDSENNIVTFRNIGKVQAPCEKQGQKKDPDCFATDTYKMVYKPTGEALTQQLP